MKTSGLIRGTIVVTLALAALVAMLLILQANPSLSTRAAPGVLYVAPGGNCGPMVTPCYSTVQFALDAALPGDEIRIAAGVYSEVSQRPRRDVTASGVVTQVAYITQSILLRGGFTVTNWITPDPLAFPTILDAQGRGRAVYVAGNISVTLEGLRLAGGNATGLGGFYLGGDWDAGGGMAVFTAHVNLRHNQFSGNIASSNPAWAYCGGLMLNQASGQVLDSTFINNTASVGDYGEGGGLCVFKSRGVALRQNLVLSNTGSVTPTSGGLGALGGGVSIWKSQEITLSDNVIVGNRAHNCTTCSGYGGGVAVWESQATLIRNRIAENVASTGDTAPGWGGGLYVTTGTVTLEANQFLRNNASEVGPNSSYGSGLYLAGLTSFTLTNNLVAQNYGLAAIHVTDAAQGRMLHTTLAENSGGWAVNAESASTLPLVNSIVAWNGGGLYGAVAPDYTLFWQNSPNGDGVVGTNVFTGDPVFFASWMDDYRIGYNSAALNVGRDAGVTVDFEGQARPTESGFDLGFDEGFSSIQKAIDAALPGSTVVVPPGTYVESLTLYKPVNLMGYGPGTTIISATAGQRVLTVTGPGINDSVLISELTLTGGDLSPSGACPDSCGGGVLIRDGARPRFQNVRISDNRARSGGGLYVESGGAILRNILIQANNVEDQGGGIGIASGAVVMEDGDIGFNTAHSGGGVYVGMDSATFTQLGGVIEYNQAVSTSVGLSGRGGGVYIDQGSAALMNGQMMWNDAAFGGGVFLSNPSARFTQWGGEIIYNLALEFSGGGLYVQNGQVTLNDGLIGNNFAGMDGGGLFLGGGAFTQRSGTIVGNQVYQNGGGLYVVSGDLALNGGQIVDNRADLDGGGLFIVGGNAALSGGRIMSNTAGNLGGGVYLGGPGAFGQTGGSIERNTANAGGGATVETGTLMLNGGAIVSNTASLNGGGVHVLGREAVFTQTGGVIAHNQAQVGNGGGVYVEAGRADLLGGQIGSNTAVDGGGIYVTLGELQANGPVRVIGNLAEGNGGGLYAATNLAITGTRFIGNQAGLEGGGLYHTGNSNGRIVNVLLARNQAGQGSSEVLLNSSGQIDLLHVTMADDALNSGSAVVAMTGTVHILDTIIASHTVGISGTNSAIYEDYNLFFGNPISQTGPINHGGHSFSGDPAFVNPAQDDYHITRWSAALNTGAPFGVFKDFDGQPRPVGPGFDIGADEAQVIWGPVGPTAGYTLVYTNAQGTTTWLQLPSNAVTGTGTVVFSVVETSTVPAPLANYAFAGDTFELEVLMNITSTVPLSLTQGVTLTIHYSDADLGALDEHFLALYRAVNMGWEKVGVRSGEWQTLDTLNNVLMAHLLSLSRWGEMGVINTYNVYLPIVLR